MPTFSDVAAATYGTSEAAAAAIKVPGGSRIIEIGCYNVTGTGVVYQLRLEYPGVTTPQKYIMPVLEALQGTEVGSGTVIGKHGIDVDIMIHEVTDIVIYGLASLASQTCVVYIKWVK